MMHELDPILQAFAKLPKQPADTTTFLEIGGYPHLENVASNILAFYFQSSNPHHFGNIGFRALMLLIDQDISGDYAVTAQREAVTREHKRIDLVIETAEFVIGIENKIQHRLDNDLLIYQNHLESIARGRTVYGFVLALHQVSIPLGSNFKSISYKQLLDMIKILYAQQHVPDSNKYSFFFNDFAETMQHLARGTSMNLERLAFFQSNQQQIQALLNEAQALRDEMQAKLKQLAIIIQPIAEAKTLKQSNWSPKNQLFEILNYKRELEPKVSLQIDIIVSLEGWHMQFLNPQRWNGDPTAIRPWLDQRNIPYEATKGLVRLRLVQPEPLPYTADLGAVAEWVVGIIKQLFPER